MRFNSKIAQFLYSFFFSSALFLLGAVLLRLWDPTIEQIRGFLPLFGYGVFGAGAVLGWLYNWSRAVFTIVILFLAAWGLPRLGTAGEPGSVVTQAAAALVPLNLLVLSFHKERGIITRSGALTIVAIAG